MTRWSRIVLGPAVAAAVALTAVAGDVATAAPAPVTNTPAVAHWRLPAGFYVLRAWHDAMWAVRIDGFHSAVVDRIDPATNTLTTVTELRFAGGGFAVGFGSLWISDWFGNAVWRIAPSGTVQARIPTGLQPGDVQVAFGAVWVSNHHDASVTRVDPATDGVAARVPIGNPSGFRDGPGLMASDGTRMWVTTGGSVDHPLAIDPTGDRVLDLAGSADGFCSGLTLAGGTIWSADPCTGALYGHDPHGAVRVEVDETAPADPVSSAVVDGALWVGVDRQFDQDSFTGSHGVLEQRDPTSGALRRTLVVGGDVGVVAGGFGSVWAVDLNAGSLRRFDVPATGRVSGVPVR